MNGERATLALLNAVLGLAVGESHAIRETYLPKGAFHRYRDGWYYLPQVSDRSVKNRAVLGWFFRDPQDTADFLVGYLGARHRNFVIVGDRL